MKSLLLLTVITFLVGLILSIVYVAYLFFLAYRSRKKLNSNETFIALQINKI